MPARFVACTSCSRLVFASEPRCPFCASTLARRVAVSIATVGAGLSLIGCPDKATADRDASPSASASASASATASASASTDAGDPDAAMDLFGGGDLGTFDGGLTGRGMSGVYGPAITSSSGGGLANLGIRGECQIGASKATVPIADADRVIAGLRPRFRAAYNRGLTTNPVIDGTVDFTAKIAKDGSVTGVAAKSNLPESVLEEMKAYVGRAQFSAVDKESVLTWTITCKKQG